MSKHSRRSGGSGRSSSAARSAASPPCPGAARSACAAPAAHSRASAPPSAPRFRAADTAPRWCARSACRAPRRAPRRPRDGCPASTSAGAAAVGVVLHDEGRQRLVRLRQQRARKMTGGAEIAAAAHQHDAHRVIAGLRHDGEHVRVALARPRSRSAAPGCACSAASWSRSCAARSNCEAAAGLLHALLQLRLHLVAAALEHLDRRGDVLGVVLAADQPDARRRAASDLVLQARAAAVGEEAVARSCGCETASAAASASRAPRRRSETARSSVPARCASRGRTSAAETRAPVSNGCTESSCRRAARR